MAIVLLFDICPQSLVMQCTESQRMWTRCLEGFSSVLSVALSAAMYVGHNASIICTCVLSSKGHTDAI